VSPIAAGRALHVLARVALRIARPLRAKRMVDAAARWIAPLPDLDVARGLASAIDGQGTCLSRALTVAALLPEAEVVIGVDPRASSRLYAHAWVEHGGHALRASDVSGLEIARLASDEPRVGG
jgi:hypothetical protein